jgi:hypothetical protein
MRLQQFPPARLGWIGLLSAIYILFKRRIVVITKYHGSGNTIRVQPVPQLQVIRCGIGIDIVGGDLIARQHNEIGSFRQNQSIQGDPSLAILFRTPIGSRILTEMNVGNLENVKDLRGVGISFFWGLAKLESIAAATGLGSRAFRCQCCCE